MQQQSFDDILKSIPLMSPDQITILREALPPVPAKGSEDRQASCLLERLKFYFGLHPVCPHCHSESIKRWGQKSGHQRYRCKQCQHTFNAMTGTPLAHLRVRDKLDAYVECMNGSTTLRPAARKCGVPLNTSFHLRHRLMAVVETDHYGDLTGISEEDETFFRESHKGQRDLPVPARRRGGRIRRHRSKPDAGLKHDAVKQVPVMVACDREHHVIDAVLSHVSTDEIHEHLCGHIQAGSTLCTDGHLSHDNLGKRLGINTKTLVAKNGQHVKEGVYHIQTVNAYHSDLKRWLNGFFNGVATKYLSRYLAWKRYLKTHIFSEEGFLDQISIHWVKQHLM
ncbi:IS1595 family transposase [Kistimonas asteriae]|uniref:IS1595 family transposase n=1 Tax=Kistimonas asteriae TaxID=517724 RepID=UPI001BA69186|nr:IS1595 family transposase [Kistimonas asteriae]